MTGFPRFEEEDWHIKTYHFFTHPKKKKKKKKNFLFLCPTTMAWTSWSAVMLALVYFSVSKMASHHAAAALFTKENCPQTCGTVDIPYPFGVGAECSLSSWYDIKCEGSSIPPKAILRRLNLEVFGISLKEGTMRVRSPVFSDCAGGGEEVLDLTETPFVYNNTFNRFTVIGCGVEATVFQNRMYSASCVPSCGTGISSRSSCSNRLDCCQVSIPEITTKFDINFKRASPTSSLNCNYAFVIDQEWFTENLTSHFLSEKVKSVPVVLEWWITNGTCVEDQVGPTTLCGYNSNCKGDQGLGYQCHCRNGFEGNPYIPSGCQDVNECVVTSLSKCSDICYNPTPHSCETCNNLVGSYSCACPSHYYGSGWTNGTACMLQESQKRVNFVLTGVGFAIGLLILSAVLFFSMLGWLLHCLVKERKDRAQKKFFYKRNFGRLTAQGAIINDITIYTSQELFNATGGYHETRLLGRGGQGCVYKGMVYNGTLVAVKRSSVANEEKLDEYISEITVHSLLKHENVLLLDGICLETQVPQLVYKLMSNGDLYHHLHREDAGLEFSCGLRLRIAMQAAKAVNYLHKCSPQTVLHRDIKSMNVLLDSNFCVKLADFGFSRRKLDEQSGIVTEVVGTFGYVDPVYHLSREYKKDSDIYSLAVLILEVLTVSHSRSGSSLKSYITMAKYDSLPGILHPQVLARMSTADIQVVSALLKSCLSLKREERPSIEVLLPVLETMSNRYNEC